MSSGFFPVNIERSIKIKNIVLICMLLVAVTLAVYMKAGGHQFINFDDGDYVTDNPHIAGGISGKNIVWAFSSVEANNWHPVTWLSHMVDVQLYGMNPRGHHLTNVGIHTITTLLLFLFLLRLTGAFWQCSFVAALFALHPLHVESVAWVSERKDLLGAFFWFLTLIVYVEYTVKRKPVLYILSLTFFMLGLMSKPMLVTLPLIMLLIDFHPLERFQYDGLKQSRHEFVDRLRALVIEKIPFLACSFISGAVTVYAQHKGGVMRTITELSLWQRVENAMIAYLKYIGKTFWPSDLAILYPFPPSIPLWQPVSSMLVLLLLSVGTVRIGRRYPYVLFGWFWFLIILLPVIGLIQVGNQSMADRYSYIPAIELFIIVAWGVPDILKGMPFRHAVLALIGCMVIITPARLTLRQLDYWQDNISLYRHTLQVTTNNYLIHNLLGSGFDQKGELNAAIQEYEKALLINPGDAYVHYNLGATLAKTGNLDAAIKEYKVALGNNPDIAQVHNNLGLALAGKGELDAAIQEYQAALRVRPYDTNAHNNLGIAFAKKGSLDTAIREFREALLINPNNTQANNNLERAVFIKKMHK